jgi:hypothetical protein
VKYTKAKRREDGSLLSVDVAIPAFRQEAEGEETDAEADDDR